MFQSHPTGVFIMKELKEDLKVQFHVRLLENSLQTGTATGWMHHPVQICLSAVRMGNFLSLAAREWKNPSCSFQVISRLHPALMRRVSSSFSSPPSSSSWLQKVNGQSSSGGPCGHGRAEQTLNPKSHPAVPQGRQLPN